MNKEDVKSGDGVRRAARFSRVTVASGLRGLVHGPANTKKLLALWDLPPRLLPSLDLLVLADSERDCGIVCVEDN